VQLLTDSVRLDVERDPEELEESSMGILEQPCKTRRSEIRCTGGAVLRTPLCEPCGTARAALVEGGGLGAGRIYTLHTSRWSTTDVIRMIFGTLQAAAHLPGSGSVGHVYHGP